MIRFGYISEFRASDMAVRVVFDEDGIISHWLPMIVPSSKGHKYVSEITTNMHVACVMDANNENGVCLGAIYDAKNKPGFTGTAKVVFSDGTAVSYNAATHVLEAVVGTSKIKASQTGLEISRGAESVKKVLDDAFTALELLTVTCAAPGSPSSPPTNLASFTALKTRLLNLFTA